MPKRVFFSFHYERDSWRVAQVRNCWVTKPNREDAGYWDAAKWEKIKSKGDSSIKKWIDESLKGTSTTIVLIGAETNKRKWVKYEIEKSLQKGNNLLGIKIHNIKDQQGRTDRPGSLDFGLLNGEYCFTDIAPIYDWVNDEGYYHLADWINESSPEDDVSLVDIILGAVIGGLVFGFVTSLFSPKCPYCKRKIDRDTRICPYCGRYIR